jgi:hypothetical protein
MGHIISMAQIPKFIFFEILYIVIGHLVLFTLEHFIYINN